MVIDILGMWFKKRNKWSLYRSWCLWISTFISVRHTWYIPWQFTQNSIIIGKIVFYFIFRPLHAWVNTANIIHPMNLLPVYRYLVVWCQHFMSIQLKEVSTKKILSSSEFSNVYINILKDVWQQVCRFVITIASYNIYYITVLHTNLCTILNLYFTLLNSVKDLKILPMAYPHTRDYHTASHLNTFSRSFQEPN